MKKAVILFFVCMMPAFAAIAQSQQEKNKAIIERFAIAYKDCDLNTIAEIVSKEVQCFYTGGFRFDYDGLINKMKEKQGTTEKIDIEEMVAEGNKVATKWTAHFTNAVYKGMHLYVIEDGKIIEWWDYYRKTE
jgi:predicted ester cyclase